MSETKNLKLFKHNEPLESNENTFDIDKALNQNWDKVDEYVETTNTKIQTVETDNTKNKQDISNIQTEQETQNINIESLQKENAEIKEENSRLKEDLNAFPTVSGSGEYVTLDAADSRFKEFKAFGKSWQKTRVGKNHINSFERYLAGYSSTNNGITFTLLEDGKIKINGTATGGRGVFTFALNGSSIEAGDYILSGGSSTVTAEVALGTNYINVKGNTKSVSLTEKTTITYVAVFVENGTTVNNEIVYVQLEKGTVATEYETYGEMPSAEFISEIRNVGDNGNLYDKDSPNVLDTPLDSNGLGTNAKDIYKTVWIPCKSNTTYTVSKKYDATKNRFALAYTSEEIDYSQQVEGYISNIYTNVMTITTNSTAKYLIAYVWVTGGSVTYQEMLDSIKIEKGAQATANGGYGRGSIEIDVYNKNLLDPNLELFQGNYNNSGNIITNTDKRIDKYIFLQKGNYILWSTSNNWINVLIYDKNKELLSVKNSNTNKELTFTLDEDGYIRFGFNPVVEDLNVFQLERNTEKTTSEEHKQQIIVFPFEKSQRLMEGDYLAEDGIHHKRKQMALDGTEKWNIVNAGTENWYYEITNVDINVSSNSKSDTAMCSHYKIAEVGNTNTNEGLFIISTKRIRIRYGKEDTVDDFKAYLAAQKEAGTPVVIEYELAAEEVEEYTEEQQKVYEQIKNAKSYEGQTNIFSTDEISPDFEITARRDLNAILNSLQAQILAN